MEAVGLARGLADAWKGVGVDEEVSDCTVAVLQETETEISSSSSRWAMDDVRSPPAPHTELVPRKLLVDTPCPLDFLRRCGGVGVGAGELGGACTVVAVEELVVVELDPEGMLAIEVVEAEEEADNDDDNDDDDDDDVVDLLPIRLAMHTRQVSSVEKEERN